MATARPLSVFTAKWGSDAIALAEQAKVLSGAKLAQLVRRLQRQTGRTQEECWRFVIKYGIKAEVNHRRWHQEELDEARELLTKYSVELFPFLAHNVTPQVESASAHSKRLSCTLVSVAVGHMVIFFPFFVDGLGSNR